MDELCLAGFVLPTDSDMQTNAGVQVDALEQTIDQVSGLRRRLNALEREFKDPDGMIARLEGRIKSLEDRRGGDTIKQGGKTFRDVTAVTMWVQTFRDKDLYRYCVDMVTLIMLCAEPYDTIAEGMAMAAAAHKAEYNSLTEDRISLLYRLTHPENIMRKQDKEKYAAIGGWYWTTTWSRFAVFKGTFNNGAKEAITSSLTKVLRMIQIATDFLFPPATYPIAHVVFT